MCGIVGYFNLNGAELPPEQETLKAMCASIYHRGPDEEGRKVIGPAALGMRRLAIIDLKSGQQPITNETGDIWLIFNGEIYNFHELKAMLVARGHSFSTQSDTETIVHLFEDFGVGCLEHLEGMFAFALFDTRNNTLFLARDRMGEKPLHWAIVDGSLVFSSEIKSILLHPKIPRELDIEALQQYLLLEYVPAPRSIFKGINKLPPAHYLLVKDGEVSIKKYWEPKIETITMSEDDAAETLLEVLERSVQLRLISDVPLGVFLSGGIDSSIVAALAAKHTSGRLKTFSIGFQDESFDESQFAKTVADRLGTEHHVATFDSQMALSIMEELWNYLDEPMADASILPTFYLSKMTKRSVTVALSGEGGDELFGGYPTYQAHRLTSVWNTLPRALKSAVLEPLIRALPASYNNLSVDYKLKRFIASAQLPVVHRHLRWMGAMPMKAQESLIREKVLQVNAGSEQEIFSNLAAKMYRVNSRSGSNSIDTAMLLDMVTYLPDDLLFKSDRASMAASLEARLPFLAFPVVEFALSLPTSYKLKGLTTKYLLKKAARPSLPSSIVSRPKKGFGIPVAKWLRQDLKPLVDQYLCRSFIENQGLFNSQAIDQLLNEHNSGRVDHRKELWTLLTFQCWWSRFLGG